MNRQRIILFFALVFATALLGIGPGVTPAQAVCATPAEAGTWVNYNPNSTGIARVDIRFQCQDQIINGQPYPAGAPYYLRLWQDCQPIDCEWGEHGAQRYDNGWVRTTIYQGYATRTVWAKVYDGGWLRVWVWTDYANAGQADYATDDWFRANLGTRS